jgi:tripartite-type tricarboxylate transporter receptor subunit TctC
VEGTSWFAVYSPDVRERFLKLGLEPTGGSAADLQAIMKRDTDRRGSVVKALGFRAD